MQNQRRVRTSTVGADGNTSILDETTRSETLEVLFWSRGPTLTHLSTTRLRRKLDGQDVLALGVADEIDRSHVDSKHLLLSNEIDWQLVGTEGFLDPLDIELLVESTGIRLESDAEEIDILLLSSINDLDPSLLGAHLRNTSPIDDAARFALESLVSWLVAQLAELGVGRAVTHGMSPLAAGVANTGEGTVNLRVGTVGLVVSNLSAVEALSGQTATLRLVRALTSQVSCLLAAAPC